LELRHAVGVSADRRDEGQALLESGERQPDEGGARAAPAVSLAAIWPDILASVPAEDRQLAERTLVLPLVSAYDEDLADVISTQTPGAFDFLIVDGVVLKETTLARRSALELLGPGDVLAPPLTAAHQLESRAVSRYLAHGRVSLAAIEAHTSDGPAAAGQAYQTSYTIVSAGRPIGRQCTPRCCTSPVSRTA
jgi:hypothetical protein